MTVDGWSKGLKGVESQYFLGLTGHWMNDEGVACEALLAVTDAKGHDSATLKGFVEETLKDYCLIDDAPSITYDNVTSNVSAFDHSSGSCLDELGGTRCLAHVLQLGVKAIFQLPE